MAASHDEQVERGGMAVMFLCASGIAFGVWMENLAAGAWLVLFGALVGVAFEPERD